MSVRSSHETYTDPGILVTLPQPESTSTYLGIHHKTLYDLATEVSQEYGLTKMKDRIEVTHEGQRAYMSIYFEGSLQGYPLTIGLRSTYDRSASIGIAVGPSIFICSNQIIHGDDITLFRKHTTGAMRDLGDMYRKAFEAGTARYDDRVIWMEGLKETPLTTRQGLCLVGAMNASGVVDHGIARKASEHWLQPEFEQFRGENNMYGLHNAFTWAAHSVRPEKKFQTHRRINEFVETVTVVDGKLILA